MLAKIKKFLYSSWLGGLYFDFLLWIDRKKFEKERYYEKAADHRIVYNATKAAYTEGLKRVKDKVRNNIKAGAVGDNERFMEETGELLHLAKNEHTSAHAETLKLFIKKDKDIKNPTDMARMVDQRINDYYELQRFNEERALIKAIKKAKKENNLDLANQLEKQWSEKYGRSLGH